MKMTMHERAVNEGIEKGFEKGVEKGIEKGIEKGRLLDRQELVLRLLEKHFGPVSAGLRKHVESLPMEALSELTWRIIDTKTLADAGLAEFAS